MDLSFFDLLFFVVYFTNFFFTGSQLFYSGIILIQGNPEGGFDIVEHLILLGLSLLIPISLDRIYLLITEIIQANLV